MEATTTLPAINIAEIQKVIGEAPAVLEANTTSVSKALAVGNNLLKLVETDGMSDLMDSQMANYQAKVKVTIKTMNENRKGFTQLVDKLKKEFTSLESALDPINNEIQNRRDAYATKKINEQKERERVALLQKQKDMVKIEVKRLAEVKFSEKFQEILSAQKSGMLEQFESYTLENIDSAEIGIKAISEAFTTEAFNKLTVAITSTVLSKEEVESIVADVKSRDLFMSFNEQFRQAVSSEKRSMVDKLPSKKQELVEISRAGEEDKKKLEAEVQKRKDEEAQKIIADQESARKEAEAKASVSASSESANAIVTAQATMSFTDAPKVKESYKINVTNNAAYLVIAQFWFEKEGKTLSQEKIERKTFAQMKAFCEDYATKNDEKISSPFITYVETIKAK